MKELRDIKTEKIDNMYRIEFYWTFDKMPDVLLFYKGMTVKDVLKNLLDFIRNVNGGL